MFYHFVTTVLLLCNILPASIDSSKYDIIIIPYSKSRTNPFKENVRNRNSEHKDNYRIDIENYEEPYEMPDIDNFDYMKDRDDTDSNRDEFRHDRIDRDNRDDAKNYRDDYINIRDEFIRFINQRAQNNDNDFNYDIKTHMHDRRDDDDSNIKKAIMQIIDDKKVKGSAKRFKKNKEGLFQNQAFESAIGTDLKSRNDDVNDYDFNALYGDDKIVGGEEVDINLYPYHVAYGTNCGGAVIDKRWVMTAGHCGKKPYIRVGSKYIHLGTKVNVKNSFIHPEWSAKSKEHPFDYDFQLLELAEDLKFDENVQPIKIGRIEDMVMGKIITVTGWGNTKENGPYSSILRAVRVPIIGKDKCQHVPYPYFRGSLTMRMFCAGFAEGMKDACQGDSGGPGVAYDRLLGMVSFGYGCATPGSYGVYSKVAKVRPWIEMVTGLKLT